VATGWVPTVGGALRRVREEYVAEHGHPVDRAAVPRRRVRWALTWRAAGAATLALALVGGAVAVRAASVAAGPAVVLPIPGSQGSAPPSTCAEDCGTVPPDADAAQAEVVVHVVGAVRDHGVVRLPVGARVGDAVAAAGGARRDADLDALNLARALVDGEQIAVPRVGQEPPAESAAPAEQGAGSVDLNSADAADLEELPGIGAVLAERIVDHRGEHPFTSVDELEDVPGIGPALLERLRDQVRV
jgi:competence protein ComEA